MTDRRERVANLMCNACGQPAKRGQFQLLRVLLDTADVLKKNQYFMIRACRPLKTSTQIAPISATKLNCRRAIAGFPDLKFCRQGWYISRQIRAIRHRQAEHRLGNRVLSANQPIRADHQHTILHPFNDALTDPNLVIERFTSTSGQLLIHHHPLTEQTRQNGGGKKSS